MTMNGLVYVGKIIEVKEIPNANKIEAVTAVCGSGGKWSGVVQKNQFVVGDLCEVYLQDSLLPQIPKFSFMEKHKYRIKMSRFLGVPSEALIMPLTIDGYVGYDITDLVGVIKYEKPMPAYIGGDIMGNFPSFIPKTDEPNFQRVPEMIQALQGQKYYATIKMDGSSGTMFNHDGRFGVCSRNYELKQTNNNAFWRIALKYEGLLPSGYAVQFEVAGPGIQGNPIGLKEVQMFAFNVYDIVDHKYLDFQMFRKFCYEYDIPMVPVISWGLRFDLNDDGLRNYAEQKYSNGKPAEGIVIRPLIEQRINGDRLSFKVINLQYRD